jgi:hypothetical protein
MRVLTVRQPWAWAIIHGGKDVENRSRNIAGAYRGPVAIHVAQKVAPVDYAQYLQVARAGYDAVGEQNLGHIIGVVDLVDLHAADECFDASIHRAIHLYATDRAAFDELPDSGAGGIIGKAILCSPWALHDHHHLAVRHARPLDEPIPYKGALGLRTLDDDTTARILAQIGVPA